MSERPESSAPPFRITVHGTDGRAREFPLYADAAYANAERALFWPDRPFSGEIMDKLDDREVLLLANVRLYTKLMTRSDATFHFTDDTGHAWGLPAHAVVAVEIHDPEAGDRDRPRIVSIRRRRHGRQSPHERGSAPPKALGAPVAVRLAVVSG